MWAHGSSPRWASCRDRRAAMIGNRDKSDETVARRRLGAERLRAVGVWRGELEAIVEDVRTPQADGAPAPRSRSRRRRRARTGFVREGLERAVQATDTMVEGSTTRASPTPRRARRRRTGLRVGRRARTTTSRTRRTRSTRRPTRLEESIEQVTERRRARSAASLASGMKTVAEVAQLDPAARGRAPRLEHLPGAARGDDAR